MRIALVFFAVALHAQNPIGFPSTAGGGGSGAAAGPAAIVATVNTAASTCTVTGGVGGETCTASPTAGTCSLAATPGVVITHNYGSGTLVPILGANDSTGDEFGGQPTTAVCGVKATTTNSVTISLTGASGAGAQFRITNAQSGPQGATGATGAAGPSGIGTLSGDVTNVGQAITIIPVNKRRTCIIDNDTQSATALVAAQFSGRCVIPAASTIVEVDVIGGTGVITGSAAAPTVTGTGSINIGKYTPNGGSSTTALLSGALATASGKACAMTSTSGTCINGNTSSGSVTISTTALAAGDVLYVSAATADAAQTYYNIVVIYTIN